MASTATGCLAEERSADVIIQIAKPVLQQKKLYLVTKRVFDGSTSIVGVEKKQIISSSVGRIPGTAFMRGKTGCVF